MAKPNKILLVSIIILIIVQYSQLRSLRRQTDELEGKKHRAVSKYFCQQLKSCTPGGESVCGFDEESNYLAVFEDHCTLLQVNCKGGGAKIFFQVEFQVCNVQTKYEYKYKIEESQFEHVVTTTTEEPTATDIIGGINTDATTRTTTRLTSYPTFPRIKWKTKPEILTMLLRRGFYMPFLK